MKALMDKALDFAAVNVIGDFVLFLVKCLVTAVVAVLAIAKFKVCFPSLAPYFFSFTSC